MTATLADVTSRVREIFDEPTASFLSDTNIMNWVNDGCRDLARRGELLLTYDTSLVISANTAVYTLPTDIIRIHRCEFVPTGSTQTYPVQGSTQMEMDQIWGINQQNPSSYPSYFVFRGYPGAPTSYVSGNSAFKIQLYPVPSAAGTLNIFYFRWPFRFTSATTDASKQLDLPEGWDDLVVTYAEYHALRKDRDDRWRDVMQEYESKVEYVLNVTREFHDNPHFFTTASRVAQPAWLTEFWE